MMSPGILLTTAAHLGTAAASLPCMLSIQALCCSHTHKGLQGVKDAPIVCVQIYTTRYIIIVVCGITVQGFFKSLQDFVVSFNAVDANSLMLIHSKVTGVDRCLLCECKS